MLPAPVVASLRVPDPVATSEIEPEPDVAVAVLVVAVPVSVIDPEAVVPVEPAL